MAYRISFWNYRKLEQHSDCTIDEWYDLGMNYIMTPPYKDEIKEEFFHMLRECEKRGMEVVVRDSRASWGSLAKLGEKDFRRGVRDIYHTFKDFKCVHSIFIGDEPNDLETSNAALAARIVREECGGIKAFLSVATPVAKDREELKASFIRLIKEGHLEYIVYNCYSQCEANEEQQQQGRENYFQFLNMFREIREECGVSVWISLLGHGHWTFRPPTQDDIRWQLNTAAAYGIEGFVWFAIYYGYPSISPNGPRGFAINHLGDRTQTFQWMREENWFFAKFVAPVLENATLEKVYQQWRFWLPIGGTAQFIKGCDEIVEDVIDHFNRHIIISKFRKSNNQSIISICNGSQTEVAALDVIFKEPYAKFNRRVYLAPGGIYLFDFEALSENK